jgi:4-hydroxy-4-methyl-2-oxoglutarate aldolase
MIDNQPVLTIHRGHPRPAPALIEAFRGTATSHLVDAMNGRGAVDWRIKPLDPANARFAGPALTAHSYPADIHGMVGAAMEAQAGDVICCANDGFTGTAVIGDLAAGILHNKDVAAFVTDGLARDRAGIVATGLPLFAIGISPNSPASTGAGQVGAPIVLGGVPIASGDIVVGDEDGVVVVPLRDAQTVLARLAAVRTAEKSAEAALKAGATSMPSWHDIMRNAKIVQS